MHLAMRPSRNDQYVSSRKEAEGRRTCRLQLKSIPKRISDYIQEWPIAFEPWDWYKQIIETKKIQGYDAHSGGKGKRHVILEWEHEIDNATTA